jgi:hypothetical protein
MVNVGRCGGEDGAAVRFLLLLLLTACAAVDTVKQDIRYQPEQFKAAWLAVTLTNGVRVEGTNILWRGEANFFGATAGRVVGDVVKGVKP